jgi:class 3 adenylate cyclase/CHASE2 domain-containing sensor protein
MIRASAAIFIPLLAAILSYGGWLQPLDLKLLDAQFSVLRSLAPRAAPINVVVVGFDDDTTQVLREPITLWHTHIAKFLQSAAGAGATVIGLDLVLPDRSYETIVPGYDRKLLTGMLIARRTTPIVLALTVDPAGVTRRIYPAFVTAAGKDGAGYALLPQDADGAVRRFHEQIALDDDTASTLVGQMARKLGKPVGAGLIDFTAGKPFDVVPLQHVIDWIDSGNDIELKRAFAGKAVLLGGVLKFEDRFATPVGLVAKTPGTLNAPGVVLHAQVLRNLLNGGLIKPVSPWIPLALALAVALLWLWAPSPAMAFALLALVWAACVTGSTLALAKGFELPVATVMFTALIAVGGRQLLETTLNLRERRRLQRSFGGYVSPPVMRAILAGTINPSMDGVKQFACVLFSDIRGYTTRSEHMTPEQTIKFLNDYFDRVVPIIHEYGGTVNCFMGDGIMVSFGVPQPMADPCAAAFDASRKMLEYLRNLNTELAQKGEAPLEIGIGLHAGEGVAGHIGAESRHDYSIIGDVTNVASRIEGVTKDVGYRLVCSRAVVDLLGSRADELVALGARPIKGHTAVEIFGYDKISALDNSPAPGA